MGEISILSQDISNKIAAGEVVERPVSVVKELVENSIDAGADVITVEIKNGGRTYIRVTDNGKGMNIEDAEIAFLRHATSKIHTEDDLDAIYTLGFRGEALSSIGAVAEVDLFTKAKGRIEGIHVMCRGGEVLSSDAAGTPEGTTLVVKNLFYNTPARMKFLKKDSTEAGYISDILSRLILAHPEVSLRFINNGREQLFSSGDNSLINSVYTVYGRDYAKSALKVDYVNESVHISGVIGKGDACRANRNYQSFFVNKRYIKSPLIIRAVEDAYKNQIMIGKFPMAVLNIEINPSLIDINVHPTKLEVKFSNEKMIYETVYFGVKNALYETVNIPKIEKKELPKEEKSIFEPIVPIKKESVKADDDLKTPEIDSNFIEDKKQNIEYAPSEVKHVIRDLNIQSKPDYMMVEEKTFEKKNAKTEKYTTVLNEPNTSLNILPEKTIEEKYENEDLSSFKVVGQVFSTYIIVERGNEMLIIDQHAAHERIKYEELKASFENKQVISQGLLVPTVVNLTPIEYAVYMENEEFFNDSGFEIEDFGNNSIIVRMVPELLSDDDLSFAIVEMISQLEGSKKEIITEKHQRAMYSIACRAAVKANQNMSMIEMISLIKNVFAMDNINTCPHGRPIIVSMSKKEIEKEFKRIV